MYNYFAEKVGLDYSHVKFEVSSDNENNFKAAIQSLRTLNIRGANITLPYKLEVIKYLDEIDETAALIGAVNTIVNKDGKLIGYNTDGKGALLAIDKHLKKITREDKVVVFGAGGAARAIIFEISKRTNNITIVNRPPDFYLAENIKKDFEKINARIKVLLLNDKNIIHTVIDSDFIINATSVGMFPYIKDSLLSELHFCEIDSFSPIKNKYFFDVVYNPYLTKFLSTAKGYKAKVCSGLFMMIYQGVRSFRLWTERDVDDKYVRGVSNLLKQKLYAR